MHSRVYEGLEDHLFDVPSDPYQVERGQKHFPIRINLWLQLLRQSPERNRNSGVRVAREEMPLTVRDVEEIARVEGRVIPIRFRETWKSGLLRRVRKIGLDVHLGDLYAESGQT